MKKKLLPIGIDDFGKIRSGDYYYVDKTLLIKELLDQRGEVKLFTRPRRFGKSLNISMLQYFFEKNSDAGKLFQGLKIMEQGKEYLSHMGKYPVISLTLKSCKHPDFDMVFESIKDEIIKEYNRHNEVINSSELLENEKNRFREIQNGTASQIRYSNSLEFLCFCLMKCYHSKVIILIDEYDVPLENAYFSGFYEQMSGFIRSFLEAALKSNSSLEFAVITGCLRVTKESIFTGLNNLEIISILNTGYGEYFGFVQEELNELLEYYCLTDREQVIKEWYDGYRFGVADVYNPWSVVNYVKALTIHKDEFPAPYWANTSSNHIVKTLIEQADLTVKEEIEILILGGTIEKPVHEEITYADILESESNLWNFLFFTGYLKQVSRRMEGDIQFVIMEIPNSEVRFIYRNTIITWFREVVKKQNLVVLYQALLAGDQKTSQVQIGNLLEQSISYMDNQEAFYHGFLLGILNGMKEYIVQSNRESGNGRYDIMVRSQDVNTAPLILELKVAGTYKGLEEKSEEALRQIVEKKYGYWLSEEGYSQVIHCGISFYKKQCCVRMKTLQLENR